MRKMKVGVVCMLIISNLLFLFSGCGNQKDTLKDKIIEYCAENDKTSIVLSDFTDFEWDRVIVFTISMQTEEVSEALEVEYGTYLDLNYGIVFANGDEVVYEEIFESKSMGIDIYLKFFIYPYNQNAEERPKYKVFTKEEATFECFRIQSDSYYYKYYYRLYPDEN